MANAPDRYEKFVVPEGVEKVSCVKDTKIENAATLTIQREDHTVGNVLRMQLHRDKQVFFAGYKIPHPLEHRLIVKVQTDGSKTPDEAVSQALLHLHEEFTDIRNQFEAQASAVRQQPQGRGY